MHRTSAMPSDPGGAGVPPVSGESRFDDLLRLPPGPRREKAILEIVSGVAAALAALHERGRAHGGIRPDAVTPDPSGGAILAAPADAWPDDEDAPRQAGYAAFEQYTDDPAYPCGPWTDVYGLAALAYFLATGSPPPSALARRVRDDWQPLEERMPGAYGEAFHAAVDRGLAMPLRARPRTAMELAEAMGAFPPPPPEVPAAAPGLVTPSLMAEASANGEASQPPPAAVRLTAMRPEHPARGRRVLPWAAALVLLLAVGVYGWIQWTQPPVQLAAAPQAAQPAPAAPAAPAVPTAPESAPAPLAAGQPAERPIEPAAPPAGGTAEPAPQSGGPAVDGAAADPSGAAPPPAANPEAGADPLAPLASQAPGPAGAEPAAPAAQEQPKAAPVTVRVAVRPWGEVLVNGRSRGVSPPLRQLSLAPGRYQVTVRNASAGEHRMTLTVAPGKPAAIAHEFE
ncbi:hypothetical protein [Achromobacter sp. RTa]|uniref:hypothetical protein n=1 Tax=Achromobacter sp. RTa TaxID=1532557 RepID=UPI0012E0717B|nr:hypothetical protein [Achromobacter sp. RTa]